MYCAFTEIWNLIVYRWILAYYSILAYSEIGLKTLTPGVHKTIHLCEEYKIKFLSGMDRRKIILILSCPTVDMLYMLQTFFSPLSGWWIVAAARSCKKLYRNAKFVNSFCYSIKFLLNNARSYIIPCIVFSIIGIGVCVNMVLTWGRGGHSRPSLFEDLFCGKMCHILNYPPPPHSKNPSNNNFFFWGGARAVSLSEIWKWSRGGERR